MPGLWLGDDIINIMCKKYLDEYEVQQDTKLMDTNFYQMLNWNPHGALSGYPEKSRKFFARGNIFNLKH